MASQEIKDRRSKIPSSPCQSSTPTSTPTASSPSYGHPSSSSSSSRCCCGWCVVVGRSDRYGRKMGTAWVQFIVLTVKDKANSAWLLYASKGEQVMIRRQVHSELQIDDSQSIKTGRVILVASFRFQKWTIAKKLGQEQWVFERSHPKKIISIWKVEEAAWFQVQRRA